MKLEEYLTQLIGPLFPGGLHWDTTPEGVIITSDFVIVQQMGGREKWYVDKDNKPSHRHARMQFATWGARRLEIQAKAALIADTIRIDNNLISEPYGAPTSAYQEGTKLRGFRQQFGLWYAES